MRFAKELYRDFEEARDATLENPETFEAVGTFFYEIDRWETEELRLEAAKALAERLIFLFEREKSRTKDATDEDAHAEGA